MKPQQKLVHELYSRLRRPSLTFERFAPRRRRSTMSGNSARFETYYLDRWPCSLVVKQAPDKSCSGCSIQSSATIFQRVFSQLCVLSQDSKATDCKPVMRWCKSISTLYAYQAMAAKRIPNPQDNVQFVGCAHTGVV